MAYRSGPKARLTLLAGFGGSFGTTGIIGLFSHGPSHHPVFDTVFAVLGIEAVIAAPSLYYRRP